MLTMADNDREALAAHLVGALLDAGGSDEWTEINDQAETLADAILTRWRLIPNAEGIAIPLPSVPGVIGYKVNGVFHPVPPPELPDCKDCAVKPGQPHDHGCDVERCQVTGFQWIACDQDDPPHTDCGSEVWTGERSGDAECREYGWITPEGYPDVSKLYQLARWSPELKRWVRNR